MTQPTRFRKLIALTGAAALLAGGNLIAGDEGKLVIDDKSPIEAAEPWSICDIFDLSTLYENDQGPINEISLIGRYHGQWHDTEGDSSDAGWEHRRVRAGVEVVFLNDFTFEGQFNLNLDEGEFVEDVEDLFIEWEATDKLTLVVGKQKGWVTREWTQSSKRIKTLERSALVNQVIPGKIGGVVAHYQVSDPLWVEGGLFTGNLTDDWALPEFNGSIGANSRIGYQINEATEAGFDYFFADGAGEDNGVSDYSHVFSWNTLSNWDRLHLLTDVIYGVGIDDADHSDVFGIVVMPYYDITDKLEAVLRYNYSTSDSDTGVRLYSRYERPTADLGSRGDNYHAIYAGLNYYICKDKLKLMTGIQWTTMDRPSGGNFDSWSYLAGVRLYY